MTTKEILEKRFLLSLVWNDPCEGLNSQNEEVSLNITKKMLVNDAICFMRAYYKQSGKNPFVVEDDELLEQFMVINFAWVER